MKLPEINPLSNTESTYISFTKGLLDFDKAQSENKACYFSKMIALELPLWQNPGFNIDLSSVGVESENPNIIFPKAIQYYMENIIRQNSIGVNGEKIEEVVELAFWKLLHRCGLMTADVKATVTFANELHISNFVTIGNNNGWAEIIGQIPNKCKLLKPVWRIVENVADVVQCYDTDVALYDNGNKQFEFVGRKNVVDFDNLIYDDKVESSFKFNVLLLFYKDSDGIEKLHGINFIYPFENVVTSWKLTTFTQKTNSVSTIGYQFKFNMKSCTNEATKLLVYELQEHSHYDTFAKTLGLLNQFLEVEMRESQGK